MQVRDGKLGPLEVVATQTLPVRTAVIGAPDLAFEGGAKDGGGIARVQADAVNMGGRVEDIQPGQTAIFAALPVRPVSTAGAGDTFFAGILTGLTTGLSLFQAQELGTLVAACSVTSPHTIHPTLDCKALVTLIQEIEHPLSGQILSLLGM